MKRPAWMYKQSAAVPFRVVEGKIWILLISNNSGDKWVIPKGIVDRNLKPAESAAKEAFEEAGVKGKLLKPALGRYKMKKWDGKCRIKVFLLLAEEVLDNWPEESYRKRTWVEIGDVEKYIKKKKLLRILSGIPGFVDRYAECY